MKQWPQYIEVEGWLWFDGVDHDDVLGQAEKPRRMELDLAEVGIYWEEENPERTTGIELKSGGFYTINIPFDEFKIMIRAWRRSIGNWWPKGN